MERATTLLRTFIQISDLHLGEIDPRSGDADVSQGAGYIYQNFTWLDGLLGHHGRALKDLADFCQSYPEEFHLVVTGDLTRCGAPNEIAVAKQFFSGKVDLSPPLRNDVGLSLGGVPRLSITGNHDQWGGRYSPLGGGPLPAKSLVPEDMPYLVKESLPNDRELVLAGINSDSDVSPRSRNRLLAVGSFQTQLAALSNMLRPPRSREIRVLLVHHSHARKGFTLRMDTASKAALERFLADNGFVVLLSGHTHRQLFSSFTVTLPTGTHTCHELTCGSTTQHDQVPYSWRTVVGNFPTRAWQANTLIVHRLLGGPGSTDWEAQAYVRTNVGFQSLGVSGYQRFSI